MKLGLIARCEDRGLGNLTREFYEHMSPDRVLLVLPHSDLDKHVMWYPGATWCELDVKTKGNVGSHFVDENLVREWLHGLDIVYTAETFYDWRITEWAREQAVRTVCHAMPEYFRIERAPMVDQWWNPTTYRQAHMPRKTHVVPVPIATDRFGLITSEPEVPLRWLHPAGARAAKDRNGTVTLMRALKLVKEQHDVTIRSQEYFDWGVTVGRNVRLTQHHDSVEDYATIYENTDAVIIPRKYGGLCLPAHESMAAGCALVMTDTRPNNEWPIVPIPVEMEGGVMGMYDNKIPLAVAQPGAIAEVMDFMATNLDTVRLKRAQSFQYASSFSWERLKPTIVRELESVLE